MSKRKYGFWNVEEKPLEGIGLEALTEEKILENNIKELKNYVYQELEDIKQEIRELRIKKLEDKS